MTDFMALGQQDSARQDSHKICHLSLGLGTVCQSTFLLSLLAWNCSQRISLERSIYLFGLKKKSPCQHTVFTDLVSARLNSISNIEAVPITASPHAPHFAYVRDIRLYVNVDVLALLQNTYEQHSSIWNSQSAKVQPHTELLLRS